MATHNKSFREAKQITENPTFAQILNNTNSFSPLANLDSETDFPNLIPNTQNNKNNVSTTTASTKLSTIPSPVPRKRKAVFTQEKYTNSPSPREFNTQSLPLAPLPFNPYRPSTSEENTDNVIVDNIITYFNDKFSTCNSSLTNEDKERLRKDVRNIIHNSLLKSS